jgi:hypothetical protein
MAIGCSIARGRMQSSTANPNIPGRDPERRTALLDAVADLQESVRLSSMAKFAG